MCFVPEPRLDVGVLFVGKELKRILHSLKRHAIHRPVILTIRLHNQTLFICIQFLPIITLLLAIQTNIMVISLLRQIRIRLSHHI